MSAPAGGRAGERAGAGEGNARAGAEGWLARRSGAEERGARTEQHSPPRTPTPPATLGAGSQACTASSLFSGLNEGASSHMKSVGLF